jgi:Fe2+ transport system protein FeoA
MTPTRSSAALRAGVPLATLATGARARLVGVDAGTALRTRLLAMGLRAGASLTVVRNGGRGPFVLAIDGSRIVLGRGMAHRLRVAVTDAAPEPSASPAPPKSAAKVKE